MTDQVRDPNEELAELDLDNIEMGLAEEDLEDVIESVKGERFQYAGKQCRVRKADTDVLPSKQKDWIVGVKVEGLNELASGIQKLFESEIWTVDESWVEVRVGHLRSVSREEAEDEAEWLAEQVVMLENDPNSPL